MLSQIVERFAQRRKPRGPKARTSKRKRHIAYKQKRSKILRRAQKYRRSSQGKRSKRRLKRYKSTHKVKKGFRLVTAHDELVSLAEPIIEMVLCMARRPLFNDAIPLMEEISESTTRIVDRLGDPDLDVAAASRILHEFGRSLSTIVREKSKC